jgi:MFS family permease
MWKAALLIIQDNRIRVATITLFCLGFTAASTLPYQSIIGTGQLGMTSREFGLLLLFAAIFTTIGTVVIGQLSDQATDRKRAILVSFVTGALGYGAFALFPTRLTFVLCLLVAVPISSSAFAQLFAVIRALTKDRASEDVASINSVVRTVFAASFILVPGLVGAWVALRENVSDSFAIAALAHTFCFAFYLMLGPSVGRDEAASTSRVRGLIEAAQLVTSSPVFLRICALSLIGTAHTVNAVVLPLIVADMPGASTRDVGLLAGLAAAIEIPFMLLAGSLNRRFRTWFVLVLGGAAYGAYLLAVSQTVEVWQVYALIILNAMGAAVILSLNISYTQEMMPDRPGLGTSLISISLLLARAVAAAIFAAVGVTFTFNGAAMIGAAVVGAGCLMMILLDRKLGFRRITD